MKNHTLINYETIVNYTKLCIEYYAFLPQHCNDLRRDIPSVLP